MNEWFDSRAQDAAAQLTADQKRKVRLIELALAKSDTRVRDHFRSLDVFERSYRKSTSGRISVAWVETLDKLRKELLRAKARLDDLNTGLQAERQLRLALRETALAVAAWRDGMATNDVAAIDRYLERMDRHFAKAERYGRHASVSLKRGR